MQHFYWNKKFELGIPKIDAQHKTLVDLINQLSASFSAQLELPEIETVMKTLVDYIEVHFCDEEAEMMPSALPEAEKQQHLAQHRLFIEKIQKLTDLRDLSDELFAEQLLAFLTTWLITHILGSDMRLANYLHSNQAESVEDQNNQIDISHVERVLLEALNESEHRFRFFTDQAPSMIWISNYKNERTFFNQGWIDFVGDEKALFSGDWMRFIHPDDQPAYLDFVQSLKGQGRSGEFEFRLRRNDGEYRYFYERIMPRFETDSSFVGYIGSAIDITQLKEAETILANVNHQLEHEVELRTQEIKSLMLIDALTGVGNRRFIMGRLEEEYKRAIRHRRKLSVIFLDLDHFKRINDIYGHNVDDEVLKQIATELNNLVRETDDFGRIGGEEFLAILPETDIDHGMRIAERMRRNVKEMRFNESPQAITISLGVAELNHQENQQDLMKRCDQAMYRGKKLGRDQAVQAADLVV